MPRGQRHTQAQLHAYKVTILANLWDGSQNPTLYSLHL